MTSTEDHASADRAHLEGTARPPAPELPGLRAGPSSAVIQRELGSAGDDALQPGDGDLDAGSTDGASLQCAQDTSSNPIPASAPGTEPESDPDSDSDDDDDEADSAVVIRAPCEIPPRRQYYSKAAGQEPAERHLSPGERPPRR